MLRQRTLARCNIAISLSAILTSIYILFAYRHNLHGTITTYSYRRQYRGVAPICTIPKIDAFDPTIVRRFIRKKKFSMPSDDDQLVTVVGNVLRINRSATNHTRSTLAHCSYRTIYRPDDGPDSTVLLKPAVNFSDSAILRETDTFLRIRCFDKSINVVATYNLTTTFPRKAVEDRCAQNRKRFLKGHKVGDHFDIVLFGIDSVSRANSKRHLVKTRDILLRQLDAVELEGYNKIADNTFPNILALLTGKTRFEFFNSSFENSFIFGDNDFLWNRYSAAGFRTLYGEDSCAMPTFNYLKRGFGKAPTDYYYRPFSLAIQRKKWAGKVPHLIRDRIRRMRKLLHWTSSFTETFVDRPHFSFSFSYDLTHDTLNSVRYVEQSTYEFISRLRDSGAFERNTILLVFADHGLRFGPILKTDIGRLEVNLPMMFIVMPVWFRERYPLQWRRLKTNAGRLTTPYDIHATLLHALTGFDEASAPLTLHGRSLLAGEVPRNRTCDDASIPQLYCACTQQQLLTEYDEIATGATQAAVDWLNVQLSVYNGRCAKLNLKSIMSAKMEVSEPTATAAKRTYTLTIRTRPGRGLFETLVFYDEATHAYDVFPEVSRLNPYGSASSCIDAAVDRKYCYCVK